jgi:spore coat protein U-like protein
LVGVALLAAALLSPDERASALTATDSVVVNATVDATCTFSVSTALDFGTFDVSSPTPTLGTGTFSIACTSGAPVYITLGQGLYPGPGSTDSTPVRQMSAGGSDRLGYELFKDAALTQSWGNTTASGVTLAGDGGPDTASLYARIPAGQPVLSGVYQDSVLATVTY